MQLLDTDINNFQELYKMNFGMEISKEEALAKGTQLLNLMSAVYKPMTEEELRLTNEHIKKTQDNLTKLNINNN